MQLRASLASRLLWLGLNPTSSIFNYLAGRRYDSGNEEDNQAELKRYEWLPERLHWLCDERTELPSLEWEAIALFVG